MKITPQGATTILIRAVATATLPEVIRTAIQERMIPIHQGELTLPHPGAMRMLHPGGTAIRQEAMVTTRIRPAAIRPRHPEMDL